MTFDDLLLTDFLQLFLKSDTREIMSKFLQPAVDILFATSLVAPWVAAIITMYYFLMYYFVVSIIYPYNLRISLQQFILNEIIKISFLFVSLAFSLQNESQWDIRFRTCRAISTQIRLVSCSEMFAFFHFNMSRPNSIIVLAIVC